MQRHLCAGKKYKASNAPHVLTSQAPSHQAPRGRLSHICTTYVRTGTEYCTVQVVPVAQYSTGATVRYGTVINRSKKTASHNHRPQHHQIKARPGHGEENNSNNSRPQSSGLLLQQCRSQIKPSGNYPEPNPSPSPSPSKNDNNINISTSTPTTRNVLRGDCTLKHPISRDFSART